MHSVDAICLEIKFRAISFLLCCVYRDPSKAVAFWNDFGIMSNNALDKHENIAIVGDINENQLIDNTYLKQIMLLYNLTHVISSPARVTNSTSTLIDPVLISHGLICLHRDVLPVPSNISDHKATNIFLKSPLRCHKAIKRKVWLYNKADFNSLNTNNCISKTKWNFINNTNIDDGAVLLTVGDF
jgi:hypothetical protein